MANAAVASVQKFSDSLTNYPQFAATAGSDDSKGRWIHSRIINVLRDEYWHLMTDEPGLFGTGDLNPVEQLSAEEIVWLKVNDAVCNIFFFDPEANNPDWGGWDKR